MLLFCTQVILDSAHLVRDESLKKDVRKGVVEQRELCNGGCVKLRTREGGGGDRTAFKYRP